MSKINTVLAVNLGKVCILLLCICWPLCGAAAPDQGKKLYEELRARYLTLRNTDIDVVKAQEWDRLAEDFLRFVDKHPKRAQAPAALLDASVLYEKLYRQFGGKDRLKLSIKFLNRVARDYPGHALADDALIREGDLRLYELRDVPGARKNYKEVVEAYVDADMYPVAKDRLLKIAGGNFDLDPPKKKKVAESTKQPRARKQGRPLIVLDPGHGGEDYGAIGSGGLLEKDVVLAVAIELEKLLKNKLGAAVRLTRRGDIFVPLMERTAFANDFEADLFISLHTNASERKNLSGFEVYYLDNSGDKSSRKLAERENASVRFEGAQGDLQYMLSDLIQNAKLEDSILFANLIQRSVTRTMSGQWKTGQALGVKRAPFYVLVGAHMPCVLAEMYFINHAVEGKFLANPKFRRDLAIGLFFGIRDFLDRVGQYNS
ncbi:N-acetylmuramoyl-L-alanine amidase [Oligoflexia bacterium]|nr:N-acetylmuramoyl-L-alanine amidase [Oligoflexia bacterium]